MIYNSYQGFKEQIKLCGIPCSEAEYKKSLHTPYLCFFRSSERALWADGKPVKTFVKMAFELYTDKADVKSEHTLEAWLKSQKIRAAKSDRAFVQTENYYETVYEFEVVFVER